MYDLIEKRKKTLWIIIGFTILITTYFTVEILKSQFNNELILNGSIKLIYTIISMIVILLNLFNFIYIKIFLKIFNINRSNLTIIFFSTAFMCLMIVIYSLNIHIFIKFLIKVLLFNLIFQRKKIELDVFLMSLITGVVDLLMTLLLQWR